MSYDGGVRLLGTYETYSVLHVVCSNDQNLYAILDKCMQKMVRYEYTTAIVINTGTRKMVYQENASLRGVIVHNTAYLYRYCCI